MLLDILLLTFLQLPLTNLQGEGTDQDHGQGVWHVSLSFPSGLGQGRKSAECPCVSADRLEAILVSVDGH